MRVRELLKGKGGGVVVVAPEETATAAAHLLMRHGVGGLPVVDRNGVLVGFLSERDIVRAIHHGSLDPGAAIVANVMTKPAPTCAADDEIKQVMARMTRDRARHLVVLDQGRVSGVISVGDLVKNRLEELEVEAGVLRDYVAGQRARG